MKANPFIAEIDAILPQTQCRQCGFPGCEPYAIAIAEGRAEINRCPPGGEQVIRQLAELLRVAPISPNTACGVWKPKRLALIDEQACIGCTLCILACPVDAIAGAAKQMHTVIAAECTGCELCIAPCPVDCISMIPAGTQASSADARSSGEIEGVAMHQDEKKKAADRARARYRFRLQRLEREKKDREERLASKTGAEKPVPPSFRSEADRKLKKARVQAALARVMAGRDSRN